MIKRKSFLEGCYLEMSLYLFLTLFIVIPIFWNMPLSSAKSTCYDEWGDVVRNKYGEVNSTCTMDGRLETETQRMFITIILGFLIVCISSIFLVIGIKEKRLKKLQREWRKR